MNNTLDVGAGRCSVDRLVRRVFFTMVLHPETGWTRVGRCYGTKEAARQWLPLVRGAWRGLRVKVAQCTLRWKDGQMTESSRKTLSEKFNMEPPDSSPNVEVTESSPKKG
jgi:hypothetical protein